MVICITDEGIFYRWLGPEGWGIVFFLGSQKVGVVVTMPPKCGHALYTIPGNRQKSAGEISPG